MVKATSLLWGLLLVKQASAKNNDRALRGGSGNAATRVFEHQELFKFPLDENLFRVPARRRLQDSSNDSNATGPIDLNIRFNKFWPLANDTETPSFLPLTAVSYPMRDEIAWYLKNETNAVSIICDGDPALIQGHRTRLLNYIDQIGGLPTMPRNPNTEHWEMDNDEFWDEFRKIAELQHGRRQNMHPGTILRGPDLWLKTRSTIELVADAVHDEYPGILQVELIQWLWQQKAKVDNEIIPFRSKSDFVGFQVAMAELNTWAIGAVSPMNFYAKWYAGRPRPEEVAFAITTRQIGVDDGVPPDVVQLIDYLELKSAPEFTAYPEGSPRHPSWPAMHSAASSASFWLAVMLNLTDAQYCEALRVDYAVAFARTCAGVHYATDNIAGLNLGQAIIADLLPGHLQSRYGSDPEKVAAKIEKLRFDWANFDSYTCSGAATLS